MLLEQQHFQIMKNRYQMAETAYEFRRLKNKASKDDEQLEADRDDVRARRKEVEVRMKEADVRMADLDQKLKEIREGKPRREHTEDPVQKEIAKTIATIRTIAGVKEAVEKLAEQYPYEADFIRDEGRKVMENLRESQ